METVLRDRAGEVNGAKSYPALKAKERGLDFTVGVQKPLKGFELEVTLFSLLHSLKSVLDAT